MSKLMTLFNPGPREIDGLKIDGYKVVLLANQQKDFPSEIGSLLIQQFDFVQVKGEYEEGLPAEKVEVKSQAPESPVQASVQPSPEPQAEKAFEEVEEEKTELVVSPTPDEPEDAEIDEITVKLPISKSDLGMDLNKDESTDTALCAICDKEFKNMRGYRIHLKHIHNA